jgi:hypothetical protein
MGRTIEEEKKIKEGRKTCEAGNMKEGVEERGAKEGVKERQHTLFEEIPFVAYLSGSSFCGRHSWCRGPPRRPSILQMRKERKKEGSDGRKERINKGRRDRRCI